MKEQSRFIRAFAWNHAGRIIEYGLIYCFTVLVARGFGAAGNSVYAVTLSIVQALLVVSSYGLETAVTTQYAKVFGDIAPERAGGAFRRLMLTRIGFSFAAGAIFYLLRGPLATTGAIPQSIADLSLVLAVYFLLRSIITLFIAFQLALVNTARTAAINVSIRAIELAGAAIIISSGMGMPALFLLITATASLQALLYLLSTPGIFRGKAADAQTAALFRLGKVFWVNSLLEFVLGRQADVLMMSFFLVNAATIGQYDVASVFTVLINTGITTGTYGLIARSFSTIEMKEPGAVGSYWEFLTRGIIFIIVPVFTFTLFFAPGIIPAIYSTDYLPAVPYVRVLAAFFLATRILGGGMTAEYLQSAGRTRPLLLASAVSGLTNLTLAVILIPILSATGAVIATGVAALVLAGIQVASARKLLGIGPPIGMGVAVLAAGCLSGALLSRWNGTARIPELLLLFIAFGVILLFLLYLVKPFRIEHLRYLRALPASLQTAFAVLSRYSSTIIINEKRYFLPGMQKLAFAWIPKSRTLIEVGIPTGDLQAALRTKIETTYAIGNIARTSGNSDGNYPNIISMEGSAKHLPFEAGSADIALLLNTIGQTPNDRQLIEEVHRVLRPGGTLVLLSTQNRRSKLSDKMEQLLGGNFRIVQRHTGGLFLSPISAALAHAVQKYFHRDWRRIFHRIDDLDTDISWGRWSSNIIIAAEKATA